MDTDEAQATPIEWNQTDVDMHSVRPELSGRPETRGDMLTNLPEAAKQMDCKA